MVCTQRCEGQDANWNFDRAFACLSECYNEQGNMTKGSARYESELRFQREWVDRTLGTTTMDCVGYGLSCAILSTAAYIISSKSNCAAFTQLSVYPEGCRRVLMHCLKYLLVLFVVASFANFIATARAFAEVCYRVITIKFRTCDTVHNRWVKRSGAASNYTDGDCNRVHWKVIINSVTMLFIPLALLIAGVANHLRKHKKRA